MEYTPYRNPEITRKQALAKSLAGIEMPTNNPLAALAAGIARGYGMASGAQADADEQQAYKDWQANLAQALSGASDTQGLASALASSGLGEQAIPLVAQQLGYQQKRSDTQADTAAANAEWERRQRVVNQLPPTPYQQQVLTAAEAKTKAADAAKAEKEAKTAEQTDRKVVVDLRKEVSANPVLRAYNANVAPAVGAAVEAEKLANTAGDTALIKQVAKMTDPTSAVRDAEFAVTAEVGGYLEQAKAVAAKATGQGYLTPQQRQELISVVKAVGETWKKAAANELGPYRRYAESYGIPLDQVSDMFGAFTPAGASEDDAWAEQFLKQQGR